MKATILQNIPAENNIHQDALTVMGSRSRLAACLLLTVFVLAALAGAVNGQSDSSNVQFTQGSVSDSATFSMGVPLGTYKGRGMDLPVSLNYSSSVWGIEHINVVNNSVTYGFNVKQSTAEAIYSKYSKGGWKSNLDLPQIEWPRSTDTYDYKAKSYVWTGAPNGCFGWRLPKVFLHMPDGSTHELRKSDTPHNLGYVDMSGTFYAIDGSRIRFDATGADTGTIYMPDGTKYVLGHPTSTITEKSGNVISYSESTGKWTDTVGREIYNPIPASPAATDYTYNLPGLTGVNGGQQTYTFKWRNLADVLTPVSGSAPALRYVAQHYLPSPGADPTNSNAGNYPQQQSSSYSYLFAAGQPTYEQDGEPLYPVPTLVVGKGQSQSQLFNPVVLSEIVLPDGTSYKFTYDVYGEIDKVVYPTGAYEKYDYAATITASEGYQYPYSQADRNITSRELSAEGDGSDTLEWTYIESQEHESAPKKTAIIAPDKTRSEIFTLVSNVYPQPLGYSDARSGSVIEKRSYSTSSTGLAGNMLRRELTEYAQTNNSFSWGPLCGGITSPRTVNAYRNSRPVRTTSIIFEGSGDALAQTSVYGYDTSYQATTGLDRNYSAVYDYVVVANATAQTAAIGDISSGTRLKYTDTTFNNAYQGSNILGLPSTVRVKNNAGTVLSASEVAYDECPTYCSASGAALPTTQKTWDSAKGAYTSSGAYVSTRAKFDAYGNRIEATDAKGYVTTTTYDSTYHAYPVSVTSPVPDGSGTYGSNSAFTTSSTFDYAGSGLLLTSTDVNGQATAIEYNDDLLRPTKVTAANGQETVTEYGPGGTSAGNRWIKVKSEIEDNIWSEAKTFYDGLGRSYKTEKTDSEGNIFVETEYDEMNRVKRGTNPYRTGETKQWTAITYDDLGRTTAVTLPDTSTVQTAFGLSTSGVIGNTKIVVDQAGKKRRGISDALGNMVRVIEDPDSQNLATDYVFDLLGNLRKTTQGDQIRYFSYDSMGRLIRAKQVEQTVNSSLALSAADPITSNNSWTAKYEYDDNGNITSTTDARNLSISATYDQLNRLTVRNYSDSTPDVTFYYDGRGLGSVPSFSKGKVTKVTSTVSENRYTSFDAMGHPLTSQQLTTDEQRAGTPTQDPYTFQYSYNLSGALVAETYPSGRVVKNTLNQDGEVSQIQSKKSNASGFWTYADSISRNSAGSITKMQLGNGRWETASYNERQQVTQIGLGRLNTAQDLLKLEFKYNTTGNHDNNGAMLEQKITVPTVGASGGFTATQTYAYDSLNRVQSAAETVSSTQTWKQTFSYDRYGNRRFNTTSGATTTLGSCQQEICNPTFNTSTNRFASGQYYVYDANGSVTEDANAWEFAYDAEGRQAQVKDDEDTIKGTYSYDGMGKRVKKVTQTETTIFVYGATGQLAAEYSTALASTPQVSYLTNDHLGSARVITNENGAVVNRKDFTAFGEETITSGRITALGYTSAAARNVRQDYTGYQKDEESGLEYAQARYYNTQHGRFTSVDPLTASASVRNPQSFNRYSYALNSPYKFSDPLGLIAQSPEGSSSQDDELQKRASKIKVPTEATEVTPTGSGIYVPNATDANPNPTGVTAEFKLTEKQKKELAALKKKAYQNQFVITKDNLNESANGRVTPQTGQSSSEDNQSRTRTDERGASLTTGGEASTDQAKVKVESGINVKQSQSLQEGAKEGQSESGRVNSGDTSKSQNFDVMTDDIHNFAVSNTGSRLTAVTSEGKIIKNVNMQKSFFSDLAKNEVAMSRDQAMRDAIDAAPEQPHKP